MFYIKFVDCKGERKEFHQLWFCEIVGFTLLDYRRERKNFISCESAKFI